MQKSEARHAMERVARLQAEYQVSVLVDWGEEDSDSGAWQQGSWSRAEVERLFDSITLLAAAMGGREQFVRNLGGVMVQKADIGSHAGNALAHKVNLSKKGSFSAWTVVHEFAHAWDANSQWRFSAALEKYTGGFTSPIISRIMRIIRQGDAGRSGFVDEPGRRGRMPGVNAAGYFYGDKPSGSNWKFNRKEDFAESVAMYVGWQADNDLSATAHGRIERYLLKNGELDKTFNIIDNWADYAKYFYPEDGDYARTRHWQFIDDLVQGAIFADGNKTPPSPEKEEGGAR